MAKSIKKIPWTNIALIVGAAFAWTKLGVGAAVKELIPVTLPEGVVEVSATGSCPSGYRRVYGTNKCIKT